MPADLALLHQLAAQLAPAASIVIAPVAAQLPALVTTDVAAVEAWVVALTDAQLTTLVDALPATILTSAIKRSLAPAPALAATETPLEIINGDPNVDREPIWNSFDQLLTSEQRLFVVTGARGVGKSRTVELLRLFVEARGAAHVFVHVELQELPGIEAVVDALDAATRTAAGTGHTLAARSDVLAAVPQWAKRAATGVFKTIRARLGDGVTPWFVFDHVDDMLAPDDGSVSSFFGQFAQEVGNHRLRANAPRAIFVAHEPLNGFAKFTIRKDLQAVTEDEVRAHYARRRHPDPVGKAATVVAQAKADCAVDDDPAEVRFMSNLANRMMEVP